MAERCTRWLGLFEDYFKPVPGPRINVRSHLYLKLTLGKAYQQYGERCE